MMNERLLHSALRILILLLVVGQAFPVQAQQKYWIYFREKNPVTEMQADGLLQAHHLRPVVYSRWLRAASAFIPDSLVASTRSLPFVDHLEPVDRRLLLHAAAPGTAADLTIALRQIHAEALIEAGLSGRGVKIGIIDAGFMHADRNNDLEELIAHGQMKGYRNFIEKELTDPYDAPGKYNDYHGTRVWTCIAGYREDKQSHDGLAPGAEFYLARTDQSDREYRGEEDYWIAAVEWMYDQGVRLINSSLGYGTGFDNPEHNYSPEEADGKTSAISRFADIAVKEKGMLLVMSAGNDGDSPFRVVNIPADARYVLAVGATLSAPWTRQSYSSTGRQGQAFVKPDVACYSGTGTSFSAPVITGLAACIMEARPDLSNLEVMDMIKRSAHLYAYPNNYLGHGVPDARRVMELIHRDSLNRQKIRLEGKNQVNVKVTGRYPVVFHKSDRYAVEREEAAKARHGRIVIKRPEGIVRTTLATENELIEIFWKD